MSHKSIVPQYGSIARLFVARAIQAKPLCKKGRRLLYPRLRVELNCGRCLTRWSTSLFSVEPLCCTRLVASVVFEGRLLPFAVRAVGSVSWSLMFSVSVRQLAFQSCGAGRFPQSIRLKDPSELWTFRSCCNDWRHWKDRS